MPKLTGINEVDLITLQSDNLDTTCYQGSAPLAYLALVSQADIFDQDLNPEGLQRDLSLKHASDAYEYVHRSEDSGRPRAYPEVVLNIRDKKLVEVEDLGFNVDGATIKRLRLNLERIRASKSPDGGVSISRVDGNHRLYYADGDDRRTALMARVPFQIHIGLTREQERSLFVDFNSNQKGLNTSHLAVMQGKLTPEERQIKDHLDKWIASKLAEKDTESPWFGQIHLGGSKNGARTQGLTRAVNFVSLQSGVNRILAKSQYIHDLTDPTAQYVVVRNYWLAVKSVFVDEWARPKDHLLLKNIGVLSLSILGGTIIDRCIPRGRVDVEDIAVYLRQARARWDWSKDASGDRSIAGMSGNRAALIIAAEMAAELTDDAGGVAIKDLQEQLASQL